MLGNYSKLTCVILGAATVFAPFYMRRAAITEAGRVGAGQTHVRLVNVSWQELKRGFFDGLAPNSVLGAKIAAIVGHRSVFTSAVDGSSRLLLALGFAPATVHAQGVCINQDSQTYFQTCTDSSCGSTTSFVVDYDPTHGTKMDGTDGCTDSEYCGPVPNFENCTYKQ